MASIESIDKGVTINGAATKVRRTKAQIQPDQLQAAPLAAAEGSPTKPATATQLERGRTLARAENVPIIPGPPPPIPPRVKSDLFWTVMNSNSPPLQRLKDLTSTAGTCGLTTTPDGTPSGLSPVAAVDARELEQKRVNKELANIYQKYLGEKLDGYQEKRYVCKLLYIYIQGYNAGIGHPELISATKHTEKQTVTIRLQGTARSYRLRQGLHVRLSMIWVV
ncbi:uncharacterized protein PV07_08668 [Cladophialophora immunda]|uniref:Uncharacterized protein n=1 Tax=Cladophialophora immunda TaxID=569365 RepID=A0A0D2AKN7_9EURO|nr:uncharacterized protein PV07_08668 [Cladophialophora immunda]KIW25502.1 hypothetical protein PV07_08668 [Cladophialophora immunda]